MKQTVHAHDFRNAFQAIRPDNFSYEGLGVLFDCLESFEEETGEEVELDVIGICCEWAESTVDEFIRDYCLEEETEDMSEEAKREFVLGHIEYHSFCCGETDNGSIVYRQF